MTANIKWNNSAAACHLIPTRPFHFEPNLYSHIYINLFLCLSRYMSAYQNIFFFISILSYFRSQIVNQTRTFITNVRGSVFISLFQKVTFYFYLSDQWTHFRYLVYWRSSVLADITYNESNCGGGTIFLEWTHEIFKVKRIKNVQWGSRWTF